MPWIISLSHQGRHYYKKKTFQPQLNCECTVILIKNDTSYLQSAPAMSASSKRKRQTTDDLDTSSASGEDFESIIDDLESDDNCEEMCSNLKVIFEYHRRIVRLSATPPYVECRTPLRQCMSPC